jgi:hypothetical protein
MTTGVQQLFGDDAFRLGAVGGVLVGIWRGEPTVRRLALLYERLSRAARGGEPSVLLYNVILPRTPVPSREARSALHRYFDEMRGRILGAAIVLEQDGVEGTLSRTVLSTLTTVTRKPFEMKVFRQRDVAAGWLSELSAAARPPALVACAAELEQSWAK